MFDRIDHLGIAVRPEDLDDQIAYHRDVLGFELVHRETVESQGVEAVLFDVGENHVELISPLGPDTGVAKFLEKNGPGLHHVAYQTQDIVSALATLKERGVQLIDAEPRVGIRNSRVAFLHPKSTGKVLTELTEPAH
ncbi:methylmalonyl-CoA epimerase [Patulibacter minatonensis]|uniref:methylmalonyl-CoA epimerase n=1 Tax=Patulibacter minatonensis TaxID=298163 RepID=UPI00047CF696|nr:methylmalonyl-CoA epimerase [Patulibacter minatonensis]